MNMLPVHVMLAARRTTPPAAPVLPVDPLAFEAVTVPEIPRWSPELASRPVVALDVDGVLNVWRPGLEVADPVEVVETVIPSWATGPARFLSGYGKFNLPVTVTVDPAHGDWIRSLLDRGVDVVWCTSWETAAPVVWGPLLDLPPLPVVKLSAPLPYPKAWTIDVKSIELAQLFPGRPLVWLDDDSYSTYHPGYGLKARGAYWPLLTPFINPDTGLSAEVRREVDVWLDTLTTDVSSGLEECDFVELLELASGPNFETPIQGHVTTELGRAELAGQGFRWTLTPSPELQQAAGLTQPSYEVLNFDGEVYVGGNLAVVLQHDVDEVTSVTTRVDLGQVCDIGVGETQPRQTYFPSRPDNLVAQKQQQVLAQTTATALGAGVASVKHGWGYTVWDGDVPLQLELHSGYFDIQAYVNSEPEGVQPNYCWTSIHTDARRVLHELSGVWVAPFDAGDVIRFMLDTWRRWHTARTCSHRGELFCTRCGTRLE